MKKREEQEHEDGENEEAEVGTRRIIFGNATLGQAPALDLLVCSIIRLCFVP